MKIQKTISMMVMAGVLSSGAMFGQYVTQRDHDRAVEEQKAHDARHHTTAKVVGGSAAAGAVGGAVLGGPKGAIIGAGVGAAGGAVANKVRENHGVHKKEKAAARDDAYRPQ